MHMSFTRKLVVACVALSLLAGAITLVPNSVGQEPAKTAPAKAATKPRGRLPPYYADVVTEKQRISIYAIQFRYDAELEVLKAQMREIVSKRDAEIEALLSAEQKSDLVAARTAAEAKRKKKADAAKAADADKKAAATGK